MTGPLELDPKGAAAYLDRGIAKAKKGDQTGADADLARAQELNPDLVKNK